MLPFLRCAGRLVLSRRKQCFLPVLLGIILPTGTRRPGRRRLSPPPKSPTLMILLPPFRRDTTPWWGNAGYPSPGDNGRESPLPGRFCSTPASLSWMKLLLHWIRKVKLLSRRRWAGLWKEGPPWL